MNLVSSHPLARHWVHSLRRARRWLAPNEPLRVFRASGEPRDGIEAVYVINLDRQPARWTHALRETDRLPVGRGRRLSELCHRMSAVDGRVLDVGQSQEGVARTYPLEAQYFVDPDPRLLTLIRERPVHVSMSREETAVALSHISAWKRLVSEERAYALVLEDDVFFERDFAARLNDAWRELPADAQCRPMFDVLYLSFREVDRGARTTVWSANLRRPSRGYWWLSGYVLSAAGARKLLDALPVVGPVDLWMNHRFADMEVFSTHTSVIFQRTDLGSDNRYSILPLLSQIGVQMDKTHLILEQTKGRAPVFGVGYGPRAAAVLASALSLLGYRCCTDPWNQLSSNIQQLLDARLPLLFDAYVGVGSVSRSLSDLHELYPEAVFITPSEAQPDGDLTPEGYRTLRQRFARESARLLTLNAAEPAGWKPLCSFLGCKAPVYPFPAASHDPGVRPPFGHPVQRLPLADRVCVVQEHDVHPWIIPYQRMHDYGVRRAPRTSGTRVGVFLPTITDDFSCVDTARWSVSEGSFPSNLAVFRPENLAVLPSGGCRMTLETRQAGAHEYTAASLVSKRAHLYGRFEATLKPARAPGVVTAFFLHRNDPWQELDIELLGRDTRKVLLNVYFNPGDPGTRCNYGARGTPVVLDLGFDAAEDYHRYAIEWEPHEIRWFVDDHLVHARGVWEPTPVPDLPMGLHCSIWPPNSQELAGELRRADLPVSSDLLRVDVRDWGSALPTNSLDHEARGPSMLVGGLPGDTHGNR
jgi:GR25 family glycosyltransferase involved in LPS biosynthesis